MNRPLPGRPAPIPRSTAPIRRPGDGPRPAPRAVPPVVRASPARRAEIEARQRSGELVRRRRGRYAGAVDPDVGPALRREQRVLQLVAAVASTLSTDYVFSHETAALLHGLPVVRLAEEVHVSQRTRPRVRRDDRTLRRHAVDLPPADRVLLDGLPVTTVERTTVDCARSLPGARALVIADGALRAGAGRQVLADVLRAASGGRGVQGARRVLALADERAESPGESLVRWHLVEADVEPPDLAVAVPTRLGTFWVDLGWPRLKVAVEFDGALKYDGRFGDPRSALLAEKRRHDALVEAGWTVLRVTWEDLSDPARLVARVRSAVLAARGRSAR